jgi:hypothetical protein
VLSERTTTSVAILIGEFEFLSDRWSQLNSQSISLVDSDIAQSIRKLSTWLLHKRGAAVHELAVPLDASEYCQELRTKSALPDMAPLDKARLEWLSDVFGRLNSGYGI